MLIDASGLGSGGGGFSCHIFNLTKEDTKQRNKETRDRLLN
ncbi:MAG: hypothetical protein Q8P67_03985 [archaeon]|nr:hypothetical protein [archaeon]